MKARQRNPVARKAAPAAAPVDDLSRLADSRCERAMLASAWIGELPEWITRLEARDFCDPFCRWLWHHLAEMAKAGEPLTMVALIRRVQRPEGLTGLDQIERDGWAASAAELLREATSGAHAAYYFRVLRSLRCARAAVDVAGYVRHKLASGEEPRDVIAWAHNALGGLQERIEAAHASGNVATPEVREANETTAQLRDEGGNVATVEAADGDSR